MFYAHTLLATNWTAIGAVAALALAIPTIVAFVASGVARWWKRRSAEVSEDDALQAAVFGREADPPYPRVVGALKRLEVLEQGYAKLQTDVDQIKQAILPNGGSSVADKITRIDNYLMRKMREEDQEEQA